jgi:CubicO group peptidase (beta-lactamase class C family)
MAVTIVKEGQIIFNKGYGVRELGTNDRVDTQTLFSCASTTKAMTAVCLAMLVDEGKVKWDDPVIKYFPDFVLYDPYVTRELQVRDLLLHNSGVGNTDFLFGYMDIPADEILFRMRLVKPSYSFRSSYIYQNVFYLVAGKVIEKVSGQSWESFIQDRIFRPLGMTRTYPGPVGIPRENLSKPHFLVHDTIRVIPPEWFPQGNPAGGVKSTIEDMGKWVLCMLDSSKYVKGRLLKPGTWEEIFRPKVMVPAEEFYPTMQLIKPNWTTYSFGWFQNDYRGRKVDFHTGGLAGEKSIIALLPDSKLGIYVFCNYQEAQIIHAMVYKAFDLFALEGDRDWSKEFFELYKGIKEKGDQLQKEFESKRVANTSPSKPLTDYCGKYTDPLYGEAEVLLKDNGLEFTFNQTSSLTRITMSHWHYDTFRGEFERPWYGKATAQFLLDASGKVDKLIFEGMELKKVK